MIGRLYRAAHDLDSEPVSFMTLVVVGSSGGERAQIEKSGILVGDLLMVVGPFKECNRSPTG